MNLLVFFFQVKNAEPVSIQIWKFSYFFPSSSFVSPVETVSKGSLNGWE